MAEAEPPDPDIAAFFAELDRRIEGEGQRGPRPTETPVDSRAFLVAARPVLERFAAEEPERFRAIMVDFLLRRDR